MSHNARAKTPCGAAGFSETGMMRTRIEVDRRCRSLIAPSMLAPELKPRQMR